MVKLTVFETRAITVSVDTDDMETAKKYAEAAYEGNRNDSNVMVVVSHEVQDGTNDSVDIALAEDGSLIY